MNPVHMSTRDARRIFWRTRSLLLEHGVSWEEIRRLTPAEAAMRWAQVRKETPERAA